MNILLARKVQLTGYITLGGKKMEYLVKQKKGEGVFDLWDDFFENHQFSKQCSAPIDIESDENNVYITTELPGIAKENIEIEYQKEVLFIRGEKSKAVKNNEKNQVYQEIHRGKVERRIQVGEINFEKAMAHYKNGQLELTLPKHEQSKPKRLEVK